MVLNVYYGLFYKICLLWILSLDLYMLYAKNVFGHADKPTDSTDEQTDPQIDSTDVQRDA